jgi:hypothetical protein
LVVKQLHWKLRRKNSGTDTVLSLPRIAPPPVGREIDGAEIWMLFLTFVSEPEAGGEPDCCLRFVDWDAGTRDFLRHASKSLMQYHPKECVDI